jgi:hypothetical protein
MKKITQLLILLISFHNCIGQNSIKINGKVYPFKNIDSTKHRINGWWKVVGGEYYYDDDGTQSKEKWNGRDMGKRMFISDTLMQLYSPSASLFYEKPRFKYLEFDLRTSEAGPFFKKFPPKVTGVNIYEFQDAKLWRGKDYAFGYQWFYILNSDFLAYFGGGSQVLYLERINNNDEKYGWDQESGFYIIKYNGFTGYIKLDIKKEKYSKDSFLEVQFKPQNNCTDTWFRLATYPNYFAVGNEKENLIDQEKASKKNNIYKVQLSKLKSNYIKISSGNCSSNEEWILKWRIINKNLLKSIKSTKAVIYNEKLIATKMYLIKGNDVDIIEQNDDWLHIRYYGKKTIEGWIKKSDVE